MTEGEQFYLDALRNAADCLYDTIDLKTGAVTSPSNTDERIARAIVIADRACRFRRYLRRTRESTEPPQAVVNQKKGV